jgi:hypothetical protein
MSDHYQSRHWYLTKQILFAGYLPPQSWLTAIFVAMTAAALGILYLALLSATPGIRLLLVFTPGILYLIVVNRLLEFCNTRTTRALPIHEKTLGRSLWWAMSGLPVLLLIASTLVTMIVVHGLHDRPMEWSALINIALAVGFTGLPLSVPLSQSPSRTLKAIRSVFGIAKPVLWILYLAVILLGSIKVLKPTVDMVIFFSWLLAVPMACAAAIGVMCLVYGYLSPHQLIKTSEAPNSIQSTKTSARAHLTKRSPLTLYISAIRKGWINRTILLSLLGVLLLLSIHIMFAQRSLNLDRGLLGYSISILSALTLTQSALILTWLLPLERHLPELLLLPMSTSKLSLLYVLGGLSPNLAAILVIAIHVYISDTLSLSDFYIAAHILITAVKFPGYRLKAESGKGMKFSTLPLLVLVLLPFIIFEQYYIFWIALAVLWYAFYKWTHTLLREGQFARSPTDSNLYNPDHMFELPIR